VILGHPAVGFASKRVAPRVPLAWLIAAPLWLDLIWPLFLLAGIETVRIDPGNTVVTPLDLHDFPWSHSLLMSIVWSALLGGVYFGLRRDRSGALLVGCGVFSHWLFDFFMHDRDMPLFPGSDTHVGLGLWNSLPGTLLLEIPLFVVGVWAYVSGTMARDRIGHVAFWSMIAFFVIVYVSALFGPLPPDETAIAYGALLGWIFVPWAAWIDRHRVATV
jgi:hypothetical protein